MKCKICDAEEHPVWKAHVFKQTDRLHGVTKAMAKHGKARKRKKAKRR